MSDTIYIEPDLSYLEDRLDALGDFVGVAHSEIHAVGRSVDDLRGDVETLTQDFHAYAAKQERTNRIQLAEIRLVKLRQEIEHRFGHYAEIRRMARGILEANDLAVVRQDTLRAAAEELMLRVPGYWLAPALVALAAWISAENFSNEQGEIEINLTKQRGDRLNLNAQSANEPNFSTQHELATELKFDADEIKTNI